VWLLRAVLGLVWRLVWGLGWRVGVAVALVIGLAVAYTYTTLPAYQTLIDGRARGSVTLLDREGEVFAWRGHQFGGVVTADTVSPHLKHAVIATEDRRFRYHPGVDPIGIASAIRINLREGRGPLSGNGGSTITQQTAKLLCFGERYDEARWDSEADYVSYCRRSSIWRKLREAVYALAMEAKYTKDEILTIYLNRAYLGAGAYGAEAAAQRYFGKSAADLNAAESAMIAGLLTAPSTLAPTASLERSQNRASVVIGLMRRQGYLNAEAAAAALAGPAQLSEAAERQAGGYFADWVMGSGPEFLTRDTTEDVIIRTTLDARIQAAAEAAMKTVFAEKVREGSRAQAAIVVMSADGAVRAMVGGRDTTAIGAFNRAIMAKRQTGSAFKPFVYATALELGESGNTVVVDEPYCLDIPGSGRWCPENYTRDYKGPVTLTRALAQSINVPAVKTAMRVGLDNVRRVASDFGIESDLALGPALALGASESTLLEMTGAYAGILNGGSSVTPYGMTDLRLLDEDAALMARETGIGERVIRKAAARELVWMMTRVIENGTGQRARLPGREVAGKTGTTQAARDAWFLGFTADYVAGVWMGYDDNTPLTGVTGGGLPAEIWRETMGRVHEGLPPRPLPMQRPAPRDPPSGPLPRRREPVTGGNPIENILRSLFGN
jgi:1A family penicillin-binding protein